MKVFALLVLGALVGAVGYLFGTEAGRQHKDVLVGKIRKGADSASDVVDDAVDSASSAITDAADAAKDAAKGAADQLAS